MSVIAGLQDFRQKGPPADIGAFQVPTGVMVFQFTFSGTTYICAIRAGASGWVPIDNGTEARAVLQSAIDSGLKKITIATGTYVLASDPWELQIPQDTTDLTIEGFGWDVVLDQRTTELASVIAVLGVVDHECLRIVIKDIRFCYGINDADPHYPALYFKYTHYSRVEHCYFYQPDWAFGGAIMNGAQAILWADSWWLTVFNNYFTQISDGAIQCSTDGPSRDMTGEGPHAMIIANQIFPTGFHPLRSTGDDAIDILGADYSVVAHNIVEYGRAGIADIGNFSVCCDNVFENNIAYGIETLSDYGTITGNKIDGGALDGIMIRYGEHNVIDGNHIANMDESGIELYIRARWNTISNNRFLNNGAWGIEVSGAANPNEAVENYIVGNHTEGNVSGSLTFSVLALNNRVGKNWFVEGVVTDLGTGNTFPAEEWLVTYGTNGITLVGDVPIAAVANGEVAAVGFECPPDLTCLVRATLKVLPGATQAAANWDLDSDYGTVGEAPDAHGESDAGTTFNVTDNQWYDLELVALGFFASMTPGDRGGMKITVSTAGHDVNVFSLMFEYV